jgi:membrane-bound lytic murein transglycosylase D
VVAEPIRVDSTSNIKNSPSSADAREVITTDKPATQTVTVSQVETKTVRPEKHVVQSGETLYAIAKKYDVAVMDLVGWNNLNIQDGIKPGQVLKLEGEDVQQVREEQVQVAVVDTAVKNSEIVHEVKPSETLYSVARKYGVTIKDVMDWNSKKDFSVSVGERLVIHQK